MKLTLLYSFSRPLLFRTHLQNLLRNALWPTSVRLLPNYRLSSTIPSFVFSAVLECLGFAFVSFSSFILLRIRLRVIQKRPMNRNNSNADFYLGPVGSFAGDSPPGRRPGHTSAPPPAHEVHYPSHAPAPPPFFPPHPPFHETYHHPQHMYQPHPPPPYPYGYPNQFAYPIHPPPSGAPSSGDGWNSPPGATPPKDSPHRNYGRPTPDKDLDSPHLERDGTMSFGNPNMDDSDSLVGRLSPLGSDFLGKFEETTAEPQHVEHFRMGFPSEPQLERINHMMQQPSAPLVQRPVLAPPPPPKPLRRPSPPVIPTPPRSTKKKGGGCNCKKTKCLKLYCECFASKKMCIDGCKCSDCHNNEEHSAQRDEAIQNILGRNQSAFESTEGIFCRCKRSACLKKYCEVSYFVSLRCDVTPSLPCSFISASVVAQFVAKSANVSTAKTALGHRR